MAKDREQTLDLSQFEVSGTRDLPDQYQQMMDLIFPGANVSAGASVESQGAELTGLMELQDQLRDRFAAGEQQDSLDLMREFLPQFQELTTDQTTKNRISELQDVINLSPMVLEAGDAGLDPQSLELKRLLTQQAGEGLQAGSKLDPRMQRDLNNSLRSAEIARGTGGSGAVNREAVGKAIEGHNLLRDRQGFAQNILGMNKSMTPDPFAAILGNPNTSMNTGLGMFSEGAFKPFTSGSATDNFSKAFNIGSLSQGQQQTELAKRQYDLQTILAMAQADEYNVDVSQISQLL